MRDQTHNQSLETWALYVKTHPGWKQEHTAFVNAQFEKHREFVKRLLEQPNGKEKLKLLYNVENTNGYKQLSGL